MKKNVIKTAIAAACVVAAGMGGMKAYNAANQSEADMFLAENVEALSTPESGRWWGCITQPYYTCALPSGGYIRHAVNVW